VDYLDSNLKSPKTEAELVSTFKYASFGERFCAGFIDAFIMGLITFVIAKIVTATLLKEIMQIFFAIMIALFISSRFQATPGKVILGIKVTNLKGEKISFLRALGRSAFYLLSSLSYVFLWLMMFAVNYEDFILGIISFVGVIFWGLMPIVGYLMIIFTKCKQGLHDKIFGTIVIRESLEESIVRKDE
jgi:uncharacterized RDD family membrane protein YckC